MYTKPLIQKSKVASQPGIKSRDCNTNNRFLDIFYGLAAPNVFDKIVLKIDDCCGGFKCKMKRVG